jgi:hypothetical protein
MNGVSVINSTDIYNLSGCQFLLGMSPLILSAIIYFYLLHRAFKKGTPEDQEAGRVDFHPRKLLIIVVGGILSIASVLYMQKFKPDTYIETHYEIKIEDSVPFNEIYNKYIILEEKENTFIVKERENK